MSENEPDPRAFPGANPDQPVYGQPPQPPPQPAPQSAPGQPAYGYPYPVAPMSVEDQRLWATLAHLGGLLFGFLAPLVVFLVTKDRGPFIRSQAAEALNFRITVDVGLVVSAMLTLVLIGFLGLVIIGIGSVVLQIIAAIAVNRGEDYRYPVNLRLVH
jgi:uncharacterized protein